MQGLIRLLSTCASGSPLGAKTLLLLGISGILKDILSGSGLVASLSVSAALSRPPEQVPTVTCLEAFFFLFKILASEVRLNPLHLTNLLYVSAI